MFKTILILGALASAGDDETLKIEGPPFLTLGERADYTVVTDPEDVVPVWRVADAPGSIPTSVETRPAYAPSDCTVRGAWKITIRATGINEGDLRVAVTLEHLGRRTASEMLVVRLGHPIEVPVVIRLVRHARGGPQNTDRFLQHDSRRRLREEIDAVWSGSGLRFSLALGEPVPGEEIWFDGRGRFFPFVIEGDRRENSAALTALFRRDDPSAVDLFVLRDCHYERRARSFGDVSVEESVMGVALKEESAVDDDSSDAIAIAHELGHVLGLDDLGADSRSREEFPSQERRRLMFSVAKFREGTAFTYEEMRTARKTGAKLLKTFRRRR